MGKYVIFSVFLETRQGLVGVLIMHAAQATSWSKGSTQYLQNNAFPGIPYVCHNQCTTVNSHYKCFVQGLCRSH